MKFLKIGQIVNIHGIKGEVKVYPYTDDINNLTKLKYVYLDELETSKTKVLVCRVQKNMLLLKLENVDSVDVANTLRNKYIYIPKEDLKPLEEDNYYIDDLLSMEVVDLKDNSILGKIVYVFNTGANDIYEIETSNNEKIYLPAIKQVVKKVDINSKKMYVELMEGLI